MRRLLSCSAIAAHAITPDHGFRQAEMRFLLEMHGEWTSHIRLGMPLPIHNNQIRRHLHSLLKNGFATSKGTGQKQTFRLTRAGLLHELQVTFAMPCLPLDLFFFVFYFSKRYQKLIHTLVLAGDYEMPKALEIEINSLIDLKHLVYTQTRTVDQEIEKLQESVKKMEGSAEMSERMRAQSSSLPEIAEAIEKHYPYELNAMKRLSEVYMTLPPQLQYEEMVVGNRHRADYLWRPMLQHLLDMKKILSKLS